MRTITSAKKKKDDRILQALEQLNRFISGSYDQVVPVSPALDDIDALSEGLNRLGDELRMRQQAINEKGQRFNEILATMMRLTTTDSQVKAPISNAGDEIDAMAVAMNSIADELQINLNRQRKNEKQLEAVFAGAPDAVVVVDHLARIRRWNRVATKLFQWTEAEVTGKALMEIINSGESSERSQPDLFNEFPTNLAEEIEFYACRKDGSKVEVALGMSQIGEGAESLFVGFFRDISARKEIERKIAVANNQMALILENLPIGIFVLDAAGAPSFANKKSMEILGRGILGKANHNLNEIYKVYRAGTNELYPNDELPILQTFFHKKFVYLEDVEVDNEARRVPVAVWGVPVLDDKGEIIFAIAAFNDITERKMEERQAALTANKIGLVLENLPIAVFALDNAGTPAYANKKSKEILGRGIFKEASSESLSSIYSIYKAGKDEIYPNEELPLLQAFLHKAFVHREDLEVDNGQDRLPLEAWGFPVVDENNNLLYAIAAFNDISERKRVEKEIAHQTAELQIVNKELESFSYSVSHDLRAPLRAINGFAQMLMEDYGKDLNSDAVRLITIIQSNAVRMGRLVDELLEFSKLGKRDLNTKTILLDEVVNEVVSELRIDGYQRVKVNVAPLGQVKADPQLMYHVWQNLIGNAFKYSSKTEIPEIQVGVKIENGSKVYFVRDNGSGFNMDYYNKLFGVFQRLHRQEEFEGTGVGLAIAQRIISRHNGRIWAESKVNEGACFFFTLNENVLL